ncbi:MAG TPA: BsuPI-related putative proteinase inhibitor [Longimicrobiaceae bacterium]|nr:BsuPI-related putative proteinase inhibitor [Longimicrobiaceae bacterium]
MLRVLAVPLLLALAAACADPSAAAYRSVARDGLVLTLSASPAAVTPGDTVRLVARLANHNAHPVRLDFSSGCQVLPYVLGPGGKTVYPYGGGWGCFAALTHLELAPGEVKETAYSWTAQSYAYDAQKGGPVYSPLPAGSYLAHAALNGTLNGARIELRSNAETVQVR